MLGTRCVDQCDPGMTVVNGNECYVCNAMCKTCSISSFSYCLSCYGSNYYYNGTCDINCPLGTFRDSLSFSCLACQIPCKNCQSLDYCDSCINPAYVL